jgi:hypothetical protein
VIPDEAIGVLRDMNPWWEDPTVVRPDPPAYRRRAILDIEKRLVARGQLIEVIRGPRQVGKTTGIHQIVQNLLHRHGVAPREILFVRFDLEILRECPGGLLGIVRWFAEGIRGRKLGTRPAPYVFLDEVHKLPRWDEVIKHLFDTFPVRLLLTGSSSVLVTKGGRESLAGRAFSTELPPFLFRDVLEAWSPELAQALPPRLRFAAAYDERIVKVAEAVHRLRPQQRLSLSWRLERYYNRGGYPRLHSGEIGDDVWADYLVQTVFENVLGADIPDLFPVQDPGLLRHLYLSIARLTGNEVSQPFLTQEANAAGFETTQPTVGRYLHYLADALLIREFRRYPLTRRKSVRVPAKITLTDLGVRNAIFRGAPSLAEGDPAVLGPLVETLVQGVIRDVDLRAHFWKDYEKPGDRRSSLLEVDFVAERTDGTTLPVEVKFRRKIDPEDLHGVRIYIERLGAPQGILVTRDRYEWRPRERILCVPLLDFLLLF